MTTKTNAIVGDIQQIINHFFDTSVKYYFITNVNRTTGKRYDYALQIYPTFLSLILLMDQKKIFVLDLENGILKLNDFTAQKDDQLLFIRSFKEICKDLISNSIDLLIKTDLSQLENASTAQKEAVLKSFLNQGNHTIDLGQLNIHTLNKEDIDDIIGGVIGGNTLGSPGVVESTASNPSVLSKIDTHFEIDDSYSLKSVKMGNYQRRLTDTLGKLLPKITQLLQ